jgi:hypothetical protein
MFWKLGFWGFRSVGYDNVSLGRCLPKFRRSVRPYKFQEHFPSVNVVTSRKIWTPQCVRVMKISTPTLKKHCNWIFLYSRFGQRKHNLCEADFAQVYCRNIKHILLATYVIQSTTSLEHFTFSFPCIGIQLLYMYKACPNESGTELECQWTNGTLVSSNEVIMCRQYVLHRYCHLCTTLQFIIYTCI